MSRTIAATMLLVWGLAPLNLVQAGFDYGADGDANRFRGGDLSAAQVTAINLAITAIRNMANSDPSAQNKRTMNRIADCLAGMLKANAAGKRRICTETNAANTAKAATLPDNPRKCTWTGDKINIKANCIGTTEPTFSKMIAALLHEGIHAIQWPDGSGGADTLTQREWVAYSWEVYMLCRRLAEEDGLTQAQKDSITSRKNFLKGRRDALCDTVLTSKARQKKLGESSSSRKSSSDPGKTYRQKLGDSSIIQVGDDVSVQEIQTPFARTLDFAVGSDNTGGDVLVVCGVTETGTSGGVVMYFDFSGDGLADESTETPIGALNEPISLDFVSDDGFLPAQLFVLDLTTGSVHISFGDAIGRPTLLQPTPFAQADSFPFLIDMYSLRSGGSSKTGGLSVIVADHGDEMTELDPDLVFHRLIDVDLDGVADVFETLGWAESVVNYLPTFLNEIQDTDTSALAAGMSNTTLKVYITDEDATFLGELLGQTLVTPQNHASEVAILFGRPVVAGEFVVVVDDTTGEHEGGGTLVEVSRPEITSTDRAAANPGELVNVFGRNFGVNPIVTVSGLVVGSEPVNDNQVRFTAPNLSNSPVNFFVIEVEANAVVSNIAGIFLMPDCNNNGIDDQIDISEGTSQDQNDNGIPDECELAIPTVSEWGVVVMTVLLLTAGTVILGRRRRTAAA